MEDDDGPLIDIDDCLRRIIHDAPREYSRHIENLRKFLESTLPDYVLQQNPWAYRHWRKLHRSLPSDIQQRDSWIELFFEEIYTAQADTDTDADSHVIIDAIRRAQPDQHELDRLRDQFRIELEGVGAEGREEYLNGPGWSGPVEIGSETGTTYWTRREILGRSWVGSEDVNRARREDGSGPRTQFDSPAERLMRFLTATTDPNPHRPRVSLATAARITTDVLLWCIGLEYSHLALSEWWRRLIDDPRRFPPQP